MGLRLDLTDRKQGDCVFLFLLCCHAARFVYRSDVVSNSAISNKVKTINSRWHDSITKTVGCIANCSQCLDTDFLSIACVRFTQYLLNSALAQYYWKHQSTCTNEDQPLPAYPLQQLNCMLTDTAMLTELPLPLRKQVTLPCKLSTPGITMLTFLTKQKKNNPCQYLHTSPTASTVDRSIL